MHRCNKSKEDAWDYIEFKHSLEPDNYSYRKITKVLFAFDEEMSRLEKGVVSDEAYLKEKFGDLPQEQLVERQLTDLGNEFSFLAEIGKLKANQAEMEQQLMLLSRAVPNANETELLVRYETAIERQLYKALNMLMELRKNGFVS